MSRIRTLPRLALLLPAALSLGACLNVQVHRHVDDPSPFFEKAYRHIDRVQREHPGRSGLPGELCLLVHDGSSRELVELSVPLWLVRSAGELGEDGPEPEGGLGRYEGRYHFDRRILHDLGGVGPGLLLELEGDGDKILIWLE